MPPNGPLHPLPHAAPRWVGVEGEVSQGQPGAGLVDEQSVGNVHVADAHMAENDNVALEANLVDAGISHASALPLEVLIPVANTLNNDVQAAVDSQPSGNANKHDVDGDVAALLADNQVVDPNADAADVDTLVDKNVEVDVDTLDAQLGGNLRTPSPLSGAAADFEASDHDVSPLALVPVQSAPPVPSLPEVRTTYIITNSIPYSMMPHICSNLSSNLSSFPLK